MDFPTLQAVLAADIACSSKMCLVVLLNHAGADGRAWPSQATIAKQSGLAPRTVWEVLQSLEKSGWIAQIGNYGRCKVWRVSISQSLRDISHSLPDMSQPLRDAEKPPISQPLRHHLATTATSSRNHCELTNHLTTHEPPNEESSPPIEEPEAAPKPTPKPKRAPKKPKAADAPPADQRFVPFRDIFVANYSARHGKYRFVPNDGNQLSRLLKALPELTVDQWAATIVRCHDEAGSDFQKSLLMSGASSLAILCCKWALIAPLAKVPVSRKRGAMRTAPTTAINPGQF